MLFAHRNLCGQAKKANDKLWRSRSRLYRSRFLQKHLNFSICIFSIFARFTHLYTAPRSNVSHNFCDFFTPIRQEGSIRKHRGRSAKRQTTKIERQNISMRHYVRQCIATATKTGVWSVVSWLQNRPPTQVHRWEQLSRSRVENRAPDEIPATKRTMFGKL